MRLVFPRGPSSSSYTGPQLCEVTVFNEGSGSIAYDYSGNENDPVGMHLHFSIVKSDSEGRFLNESKIENTLDPSPYFGIPLINRKVDSEVSICP